MDVKTALYDKHVALGAKMVSFAGYVMPVKYTSIREEHEAVRNSVGVFDLSHMGEFRLTGPDSTRYLDLLLTNDADVPVGKAFYSAMCYPDGGIVDDLIVYRLARDEYLMVVNASNIEKDWAWVDNHKKDYDIKIVNESSETSLIAIQGPNAQKVAETLTAANLETVEYYAQVLDKFAGKDALIARTGYTGEDGFEIYVKNEDAPVVWDAVMEAGKQFDVVPIGLGARDTLRLEVGYALYGNDIDHTTTPIEARMGWVVKLKTEKDFIGRERMVLQKEEKPDRYIVGLKVVAKGFPRHGAELFSGDRKVGIVTSGSIAPSLGHGVCLGFVEKGFHKRGTELEAEVRNKKIQVVIVKLPFYKDGTRK